MARVKICGLTRPEDVVAARDADLVGFVVESPKSRRNLGPGRARELAARATPHQLTVAVTATTDPSALERVASIVSPHALQLPAAVDPAVLASLRRSYPTLELFLACRPEQIPEDLSLVDAIVLDALSPEGYGGSGKRLAWAEVAALVPRIRLPVLLAGGLTPANVAEAIRVARPWGVDVSSGVETDGLKDPAKITEFIHNARAAGGDSP